VVVAPLLKEWALALSYLEAQPSFTAPEPISGTSPGWVFCCARKLMKAG
jgi:hypothetical protein